jgi:hypothetical protein
VNPVVIGADIKAFSAIIVAVVAALGSRLETRDTRSRILKDLDISAKLDSESEARKAIDDHIATTVKHLTDRERRDYDYRRFERALNFALVFSFVAIGLSLVAFPDQQNNNYHYLPQLSPMSGLNGPTP